MIFVPYTIGSEIANSYLSIAETDTLIENQRQGEAWKKLSDEEKEMVLVQSSLAIDSFQAYQYEKNSEQQVLKFPRNNKTEIPLAIKMSVAMVCSDFAESTTTDTTSTQLIKREVISKFTTEYFSPKEAGDVKKVNASLDIASLLKPLKQRTIKYTHGR